MPSEEMLIATNDLGLRTRRGIVYDAVDLAIPTGALALVTGPAGSGRTSLLLTLAGRMRATTGRARVCGIDVRRRPSAVRALVGLGPIEGVTDLEDALTAEEHVRSELALLGRGPHDGAVAALLSAAGFEADRSTKTGDLGVLDRRLLGVAVALAGAPRVLVADDVERDLAVDEAARYVRALRSLADAGVTVVATCLDVGAGWDADIVQRVDLARVEVA